MHAILAFLPKIAKSLSGVVGFLLGKKQKDAAQDAEETAKAASDDTVRKVAPTVNQTADKVEKIEQDVEEIKKDASEKTSFIKDLLSGKNKGREEDDSGKKEDSSNEESTYIPESEDEKNSPTKPNFTSKSDNKLSNYIESQAKFNRSLLRKFYRSLWLKMEQINKAPLDDDDKETNKKKEKTSFKSAIAKLLLAMVGIKTLKNVSNIKVDSKKIERIEVPKEKDKHKAILDRIKGARGFLSQLGKKIGKFIGQYGPLLLAVTDWIRVKFNEIPEKIWEYIKKNFGEIPFVIDTLKILRAIKKGLSLIGKICSTIIKASLLPFTLIMDACKGIYTAVGSIPGLISSSINGIKSFFTTLLSKIPGLNKLVKPVAEKVGSKVTAEAAKGVGKVAAKTAGKTIPIFGILPGVIFAVMRAFEGDWTGAGLELASTAVAQLGHLIPVAGSAVGAAASLAIDGYLVKRDIDRAIKKSSETSEIPKSSINGVAPKVSTSELSSGMITTAPIKTSDLSDKSIKREANEAAIPVKIANMDKKMAKSFSALSAQTQAAIIDRPPPDVKIINNKEREIVRIKEVESELQAKLNDGLLGAD